MKRYFTRPCFELLDSDLPSDCIGELSSSGQQYENAQYWVKKLGFAVPQKRARQCIESYGIDDANTMSNNDVRRYILWLACGGFSEGSDIFSLFA